MQEQANQYQKRVEEKLAKAFSKEERSVAGFFIKNHRFTYLIIFSIFMVGLYSLLTLPREANPEVKIPIAVVTSVLPGGTPTDVEDLITDKIEEKVKNIDNLKQYNSSSGQGISSVVVEFEAEADLDRSIDELRKAVDEAKPNLPQEAEDPVVTEISATDIPIITYSLVGDYSETELKKYVEVLANRFEQIPNVSKVPIIGELEREYQVIVSQTKLANYGISISQVLGSIARTNFSLPSGDIEIDGYNYNVRVESKFLEAVDINDIVITTYEDTPIYVRDVAQVKDGFKEKKTESRIGFPGEVARSTVSVQIYKKTGGNILSIVDESRTLLDTLKQDGTLPDDLEVVKTNDNSVFIRDDLKRLGTSGLQTMLLIVLILLAVLSLRGALITGLAVPFAFFMAFAVLKMLGMTLNSIVLFSLVLSLGLMVDNAIIVMEGVNEYIKEHGKTPYQAAILAVWNYKWAITSGTLTTVSAFIPMLLVSGILGEYLSVIPKTISATLLSSLFVAIVIIPTLVSRFIKIRPLQNGTTQTHQNKKRHFFIANARKKLQKRYAAILHNILPSKAKRRSVLISAWVLFLLAVAVPATGLMRIEMFSEVDVDFFVLNITLPVGTTLESTSEKVKEVEAVIAETPELQNYVTVVGGGVNLSNFDGSGGSGSHLANITANITPKDDRKMKSYEISEAIRPKLEAIQGAEVTLETLSAGPPTGAPIEVRITGNGTRELAIIAEQIKDYLAGIDGVINVKDNIQNAAGDFTFRIDKQKANYYGFDIASIASTLRNALYGTAASTVNVDGEDVDITVKYDKDKFTNVDDLEDILLFTPSGQYIPLKQIADLKLEPSLLSINHREGDKSVIVRADIERGVNLQDVLKDFDEYQQNLGLPEGAAIQVGGEVEDIQKSFRELFESMFVAVILIAFILVLQFNSFRQPFIIILTLPLAIIGVVVGLNILRLPFSFPAFIGIVSLAGIVVNDGIVLIDRINKNLVDGMDYIEGIIEGGVARMQPIFLTSLTTIAGIFPLIFADELWQGLSVAVIFGLMFSTVLTLFVVPVIYTGMCRKEKCIVPKG